MCGLTRGLHQVREEREVRMIKDILIRIFSSIQDLEQTGSFYNCVNGYRGQTNRHEERLLKGNVFIVNPVAYSSKIFNIYNQLTVFVFQSFQTVSFLLLNQGV